jgi:hypothetical protein
MPFGGHNGQLLENIPLNYPSWLDTKVDLREPLRSAADREVKSGSTAS